MSRLVLTSILIVVAVTTGSETADTICPPDLLDKDSQYLQVRDGSCFHFSINNLKTYSDASKDCMQYGGTLALPKTKELNDYLTSQLKNHYSKAAGAWIGLHNKKGNIKFLWEDNSELDWTNFKEGAGPQNDWFTKRDEYCVFINPEQSGIWEDLKCNSTTKTSSIKANPKKLYICQYTPSGEEAQGADEKEKDQTTDSMQDDPAKIEYACPPSLQARAEPLYLQVQGEICFRFEVSLQKTHFDANRDCKKDGGILVLSKTKSINDYLTDQLSNYYKTPNEVWIGLRDEKDKKTEFVWEDKSELKWNNFAEGNAPQDNLIYDGAENCVAMSPADGQWYHYQCDSDLLSLATGSNPRKHYVCQYQAVGPDGQQGCATQSTEDVTQDSPRTIVDICPPDLLRAVSAYYLQVFDGSCFYFVIFKLRSYADADRVCRKYGGTLALPKTSSINFFLTGKLFYHYKSLGETWIGLHDRKEETQFMWEDNTKLEWSNFAEGNGPDNDWLARGVEDCVALDPSQDGLWHDHQCDNNLLSWVTRAAPRKQYICQYTPPGL